MIHISMLTSRYDREFCLKKVLLFPCIAFYGDVSIEGSAELTNFYKMVS
jgi:hypothetical protein